jgi:hypothetical protein
MAMTFSRIWSRLRDELIIPFTSMSVERRLILWSRRAISAKLVIE